MTSKQTVARRTVATQTEPLDSVYVTQFGECYHRDRKCHGLRDAFRVYEKANVSNLWLIRRIEYFSRDSRIVESHREVSQAVLAAS